MERRRQEIPHARNYETGSEYFRTRITISEHLKVSTIALEIGRYSFKFSIL